MPTCSKKDNWLSTVIHKIRVLHQSFELAVAYHIPCSIKLADFIPENLPANELKNLHYVTMLLSGTARLASMTHMSIKKLSTMSKWR
jgi:hypothetical protein